MKNDELIRMSNDAEFVGINKDNEYEERSRYMIKYIPLGEKVCVSHNDGFYSIEAEEIYFTLENIYNQSSGISFSLKQINESMKEHGIKLVVEQLEDGKVEELTVSKMYEMSEKTGVNQFKPVPGGAKICDVCKYQKGKGECVMSNEVRVTRFNDGLEYCFKN